ncbi:MAG TPA: cell division protein FtsZ [candidate division WOR-3 bacterium]|uniref:Cell division protein FtsZ n=1 Tax=candidate division WOR-3 bacterium TaxID=2052148 RepID=A0A9C9K138_UNCW3|nr:cell division protein FtsZ [candidate division WOR-3 bacterium]
MLELVQEPKYMAKIKMIGVGGAGCNTVNYAQGYGIEGVECISVNTDAQVLKLSMASEKLQIGQNLTQGLGAGGDPEIGRKAAEESREQIRDVLKDADMVFITCGEGGGTGTGASPVIAEEAKNSGALVVAVVTTPFEYEGIWRMTNAEKGLEELREHVDTLICIPNQKLVAVSPKEQSIVESFKIGNMVLFNAIKGIAEMITKPGLINLDFADIRTVMIEKGTAVMGLGIAEGENRALQAAQSAISSPLLEDVSIKGAKGLLINITGSDDLTLAETNEAASLIVAETECEPKVITGVVVDKDIGEKVKVMVVATGIKEKVKDEALDFGTKRENLELPTFKRREVKKEGKERVYNENDLEVPTFLRRQID